MRCVIVADDFAPRAGRVVRLDARELTYVDEKMNRSQTLPIDRLVRLEGPAGRSATAPAAGETFVFALRNGERLLGKPGTLTGDDLAIVHAAGAPGGGGTTVPLAEVAAIAWVGKGGVAGVEASRGSAPTQDELLLANGDLVAGVLSDSDEKTVTVRGADGQDVAVEWSSVRLLRLAEVGGSAASPRARAPFRLTLRDGSVVDASALDVDGERATFTNARGGKPVPLDGDDVVSIEHRAGRARLLADVTPTGRSYAPFFPSASASRGPPSPLRIDGRTMRSTILLRPRSTIAWTLDGSMRSLVARYAIAEGRPMADVTVRVRLDGVVVHERLHVRAGPPSDLLRLPLGDARSLTLEVDYGDNYDVQDELHWIDAALLPE